jgi:hypothetical protein
MYFLDPKHPQYYNNSYLFIIDKNFRLKNLFIYLLLLIIIMKYNFNKILDLNMNDCCRYCHPYSLRRYHPETNMFDSCGNILNIGKAMNKVGKYQNNCIDGL